jgi:epoxyqueuosine reductase QueG
MVPDQPIDFGLQSFCESCNKCARECPSGAITAGPKLMYNGYEIWKSDAEKCARYRITNAAGGIPDQGFFSMRSRAIASRYSSS